MNKSEELHCYVPRYGTRLQGRAHVLVLALPQDTSLPTTWLRTAVLERNIPAALKDARFSARDLAGTNMYVFQIRS